MGISIKDIAKLAGVSHTTVSRVINNHPSVRPATRSKILKIIEELNFSPHVSARALTTGKTYTIGLLFLYDMQQFPADFLPPVLAGMTVQLNDYGYNLALFFDQIQGKKDQVPLEMLSKNKLDGVFILSVESEAEVAHKAGKINIPLVLVNQKIEGLNLNYVVADDEMGAYAAVSHLLDLGHKNIAFIGGGPKYSTSIDRKAGYKRALEERGLTPDSSLEKAGYFNRNGGYASMKELLDERKDITAVFAANDLMALGAMKAIKEYGLKIPDDIAVAGFDDHEFAALMDPALTTVKKPRTLMGSEAARLMLEMLKSGEKDKEAKKVVLPTRLIVRESTMGK